MTNVVQFAGITTIDEEADAVLGKAIGQGIADVVIVGWTEQGSLWISGNRSEAATIILLLEMGRQEIVASVTALKDNGDG